MNFDGLGVKPMFVLGDCQNDTTLNDVQCVVEGKNYAKWPKAALPLDSAAQNFQIHTTGIGTRTWRTCRRPSSF